SWMNKYETREHFAQKLTRIVSQPIPVSQKENLLKAFNFSEEELEKGVKENYLDFRPHLFLGKLYNADYQISQDPEDLKSALYYSEKSISLSPNNQQGYWYLGEVKLAQGKKDEAVALFQKALDLEPRYLQAHWYLAMAYKFSGQYQLAKEQILEAKKLGYDWDSNIYELRQAISIFEYFKDDAVLLPLYQKAVQLKPDDIQMWSALVAAYANLGQFDKAREVAEQVKKIKPEASAGIDEFVKSFPK
ncbi:MAG: tetratricopeptide repeat protein, partial [Candidatus Nealsonbacteria bacterium]|nr:tetratricopeptide repeat protein [Candidatus Nealsonbacteria bacterium]